MAIPLHFPLLLLAAMVAGYAARPELRSSQLILGSLEEADMQEEGVYQAIDYAISVYNQENNDPYYSRVRKVVRARKQVRARTPGLNPRSCPSQGIKRVPSPSLAPLAAASHLGTLPAAIESSAAYGLPVF
ncbi:Hypothetical predicted protein [Marmota monax]|uniref:Cystatin domain-containing protein n=1 Tax=Marmota monax TaxID=9995 RepID=A0A5E4CW60_MARMO|nr:Hypothetical predicted protein [Marmota monax]